MNGNNSVEPTDKSTLTKNNNFMDKKYDEE